MRKFGILVAAVLLAGCSIGADVPLAKQAAVSFHHQLDAGKFAETYSAAGPDLRAAATQQQWVQLLDMVHRKLGNFKSAPEPGWNDMVATGGHFITLTYQSTYEHGVAEEQIVYKMVGGKALLIGYHVTSNALIEAGPPKPPA